MDPILGNGDPAFPQKEPLTSDCHGMSLRDYFAAKAMQMEMQSARQRYDSGAIEADEWRQVQAWVADYAYEMADEMLRARAAVLGA